MQGKIERQSDRDTGRGIIRDIETQRRRARASRDKRHRYTESQRYTERQSLRNT